ncbi:MAG TPA: hypothetical protein VFW60_01590 [Rhodanobacteraceae bacterium]|nr:hypothetical protein [Rhodanobacteraceae bacterium]
MRPVLRHAVFAAACVAILLLAGCGKHVASNAPITFAPADTPYLFANFKAKPEKAVQAWGQASGAMFSARIQQFGKFATLVSDKDPVTAKLAEAMQAELANVHSREELARTTGFSQSALFAVYGIGDVPVARIELASPDAFKTFWARVEKRAGITRPVATVGKQTYWMDGIGNSKLRFLVAIEGKQLVVTIAPANASESMLKQLLGLIKPANDAADRLARIDSQHGYSDYGSGYLDTPKLFANLFSSKDVVTREFTKDLGGPLSNPACANEFGLLANQVPLVSVGFETYTASEIRGSLDAKLSPTLLGALTALKQPVPGMDTTQDHSMFDVVLAAPVQKWHAFLQDRAKAAAEKTYQCPALQSLNKFAGAATHPPVRLPPQAASLLGFRVVLDKWDIGPQIAGRALVASSNPTELAQMVQRTLPQFALKTIPNNGKPVPFQLPPRMQPMIGSDSGWVATNDKALAVGIGDGEDTRLADALAAPPGNGDKLLRIHFDGKMYQVFGSFISRFAAMAPAAGQARIRQQAAMLAHLQKLIASGDMDVKLDGQGLHLESVVQHR